MALAVVSLGSNMGDRLAVLTGALRELERRLGEAAGLSSLYQTAPWGGVEQQDFFNAAAVWDVDRAPFSLLEQLHGAEDLFHRERDGQRWGPRTLDLDLILYGREKLEEERLTVPHPRFHLRRFVVEPTTEAWPEARLPDGTLLADLLPDLSNQPLRRLEAPTWPAPRILPEEFAR